MWASALEVDTADCLNCAAGDVKPKGARWDDESLKRYKKSLLFGHQRAEDGLRVAIIGPGTIGASLALVCAQCRQSRQALGQQTFNNSGLDRGDVTAAYKPQPQRFIEPERSRGTCPRRSIRTRRNAPSVSSLPASPPFRDHVRRQWRSAAQPARQRSGSRA